MTAALNFIYPPICKLLKLDIFNPEATNFFIQIVKAQLAERKRTGLKRNDFIDAMAKATRITFLFMFTSIMQNHIKVV